MSDDVTELKQRLEEAFSVATKRYQSRGFQRRIGFDRKPALVNVDLANAWARPGETRSPATISTTGSSPASMC